ncbi:MAG: hypothetical protein ACK528_04840 [Alphaproteobacteria bacterium]
MAKYIQYVSTSNLLGARMIVSSFIIEDDNGILNNLYYTFDARKFAALNYGRGGAFGEMMFNHNKLTVTDEYAEWRDPGGDPYLNLYEFIEAVANDVAAFIP